MPDIKENLIFWRSNPLININLSKSIFLTKNKEPAVFDKYVTKRNIALNAYSANTKSVTG